MGTSLKKDVILGIIWSSIQRFGAIGISFIANLFFARLLSPDDFGCVGMLSIFIALSNVFIDGGFGSALIQRKNPTIVDYSTIFYWNILIAVFFYVILFFSAPYIAKFYNIEILSTLLRLLGLVLIINALAAIQANILRKNLQFKKLAVSYIIPSLLGAIVGVICAYNGCGVYSLIIYNIVNSALTLVFVTINAHFKPILTFSFQSVKSLFNFGGLMMLSNLVEIIYVNIQSVIIGKKYSAADLGYYTQANKLAEIPGNTLSSIVNAVTFPAFSKINTETERLRRALRINVVSATYVTFPVFIVLSLIADPLIILLYGEQWHASVELFQIICMQAMFFTVNTANTNMILSLGKSKFYFKIQLLKRTIAIICIIVGLQFGLKGMLIGLVVSSYIYFIINSISSEMTIGYKFRSQVKDAGVNYLLSMGLGGVFLFLQSWFNMSGIKLLLICPIIYFVVYVVLSSILRFEGYSIVKDIILKKS